MVLLEQAPGGARRVAAEVEFVGFADGCRVEGTIFLEDARLADLLNRQHTIVVRDARVVHTDDGHSQEFPELEVRRDELEVVVANGPRGDPKRRLDTLASCVSMKLGPYLAEGFVHTPQSTPTVWAVGQEPAMVALTDAVLEYELCGKPVSEWFRTVLVNQAVAAGVRQIPLALHTPAETPETEA
jgi:hypothetical protein